LLNNNEDDEKLFPSNTIGSMLEAPHSPNIIYKPSTPKDGKTQEASKNQPSTVPLTHQTIHQSGFTPARDY
jgi:hypothetical protein